MTQNTSSAVLYCSGNGEISPVVAPLSRMGAQGALILGIEVTGFVSLEAERGLRAMLWPDIQRAMIFPRLPA